MSEEKPWSVRIPAAIAKAWRLLDGGLDYVHVYGPGSKQTIITADEVGFAAALHQLWEVWQAKSTGRIHGDRPHPCLVLFTEKVEAVTENAGVPA